MIKKMQSFSELYLKFSRKQWAELHNSLPLMITEEEIVKLNGTNEDLSFQEVMKIYLPLSRLLNLYINSSLRHQAVLDQFFGTHCKRIPYIIGITGSVAVGKSVIARVLQALLSGWSGNRRVELVTTDGFLYPNKVLKQRDLMQKKGFPQSYDIVSLLNFISTLKAGLVRRITVPVYSHLIYDIVPNKQKIILQPDILILEGLNVLQSSRNRFYKSHCEFISDFIDFSIYVDAHENLIKSWYINRFLKLCRGAFSDSKSHFYHYSKLTIEEVISIASQLWKDVNSRNLQENILPTRNRASLILEKSTNHVVKRVHLRK
ncbi:pantothenate kinase [secondary endosymbiont of Heteropsylla cubana]|uniref:Pantothenate kinase n=1 Tax=secondary endosymbiont of Heteropsylla cubana TaxID=134287 RepID=J3VUH2_9ENTR|nr:type I pantothenate kinase [secondary endosymbiont of Heteropsylla cubana]AFP85811.1 pantothenate kinase [secondary endosymbiont of Heteropsylla cubana]